MIRGYEAVVIGAGHAGVEAALALARKGHRVLLLATQIDTVAYMPCNPNIGGTAKGHLVREIDALGGEMGINADKSLLQMKMLNATKGAAVQSLRGQTDKDRYHHNMLATLLSTQGLDLMEGECTALLSENGHVAGVRVHGTQQVYTGEAMVSEQAACDEEYQAACVVLASGVYLNARIIRGEEEYLEGPSGYARATMLTQSLIDAGVPIRRFKTGTPARILKDSIHYDRMEIEWGDEDPQHFSFLTTEPLLKQYPCYLTYTNEATHRIIRDNLHRAPMYNGSIHGVGPRYCPSIEDKVVRFANHERHQIFVEPEREDGDTMYIQGMSTSLPRDVQEAMYRTIPGLEDCVFVKYAYAIEYDCLDPTSLKPSLESKLLKGFYSAGQVNGSSGYEEAGAQGIIAGINAALSLEGRDPLVLLRSQAYIGVLIDDLVTRGTNEPYRMMTARAEYRISLRQDNADRRLTPIGREVGLVSDYRYGVFLRKQEIRRALDQDMKRILPPSVTTPIVVRGGENPPKSGISAGDLLCHAGVTWQDLAGIAPFDSYDPQILQEACVDSKYAGYLRQDQAHREEQAAMEGTIMPESFDYLGCSNLRLEARQKLHAIRPRTLGQASRISGISPADISVLIIELMRKQ